MPIATKSAGGQLEAFSKRLIEAILELAEQTVRPNESVICLYAYNHLKKNTALFNRAVANRLSELLVQEVNALGTSSHLPSLDDDEDFSLVSMEEMEDKVLIGNLSQAIAHNHSASLNALTIRVSNIMQRDEITLELNPFRPALFVQAAYEAWCQFDPSVESHRVVLRLFRPGVFIPIDPILKDLNDALIARGIVPNLKAAYRGKKQGSEVRQPGANDPNALRDKLHNLLAKPPVPDAVQAQPAGQNFGPQRTSHNAHVTTDANANIAAYIAGSALFGYLADLQKQGSVTATDQASQVAPQSAETLRQIRKQAPHGTLTVVDENTIELL
ncbi:MAG: DUF1631 family protein, partial [Burkholderiaceae bacterium]